MIKITNPIRENSAVNGEDVLAVKKALFMTGHYDMPDYGLTRYPDKALFIAIKNYQKEANLKVDGTMNPDGETIKHLKKKLLDKEPAVRSPSIRCPQCGGPHGGSKGDLCPDCDAKS